MNRPSAANNAAAQAKPKAKAQKPPETIDLSDDDDISEVPANGDDTGEEDDEDSGEIMLDGAPETEVKKKFSFVIKKNIHLNI